MEIYGPDLGMPHTRAMGDGLFRPMHQVPPRSFESPRIAGVLAELSLATCFDSGPRGSVPYPANGKGIVLRDTGFSGG